MRNYKLRILTGFTPCITQEHAAQTTSDGTSKQLTFQFVHDMYFTTSRREVVLRSFYSFVHLYICSYIIHTGGYICAFVLYRALNSSIDIVFVYYGNLHVGALSCSRLIYRHTALVYVSCNPT